MTIRPYFHINVPTTDLWVLPNGAGEWSTIQSAMDYARTRASAGATYTIRLTPGTYGLTSPLTLYSNVGIVGAGKNSTFIKRTTSQNNTLMRGSATTYSDPVIDASDQEGVVLRDFTAIHSGISDNSTSIGHQFPVGLDVTDAQSVYLYNCRFEATGTGMLGLGLDHQSELQFTMPTYVIHAENCDFVGHQASGAQLVQRIFVATGCLFEVDTSGQTITNEVTLYGYKNWEWLKAYCTDCFFHLLVGTGTTLTNGSNPKSAAVSSIDTVNGTSWIRMSGCRAFMEVAGNVNSATYHLAALTVGGDVNTVWAAGCDFMYRTPAGGLTSCSSIGGVAMYAVSGGSTQELFLDGCDIKDEGGTGGTVRKDIVLIKATAIDPAPDRLHISGTRTSTTVGEAGGFTYNAGAIANLCITPQTINRQITSVTFATATTAAVTLPLAYPTNATDYNVSIEPSVNEYYWVTAKTNTGFTLNTPANSTATVRLTITR